MDVLVLIDKLDDLVHNAKAVPLTDQVRIDREEIYDILDQMRATIPEEIKQARWIVKERQEMLAEAKREVDRLLAEAREQAVREASQTEIVKIAERQADEIVDDARRSAREMKLEMEDWADNQLASLEVNLERFLTAVRPGREKEEEENRDNDPWPDAPPSLLWGRFGYEAAFAGPVRGEAARVALAEQLGGRDAVGVRLGEVGLELSRHLLGEEVGHAEPL